MSILDIISDREKVNFISRIYFYKIKSLNININDLRVTPAYKGSFGTRYSEPTPIPRIDQIRIEIDNKNGSNTKRIKHMFRTLKKDFKGERMRMSFFNSTVFLIIDIDANVEYRNIKINNIV